MHVIIPCRIPFHKIVVPTVDTARYDYLVERLLSHGFPVLLVGPVGTGKTSTAQSVLEALNPTKYSLLTINMSAQTTSNNVQVNHRRFMDSIFHYTVRISHTFFDRKPSKAG